MKNRILSLFLIMAMLLSMFNVTAMAASEPTITSHKNGKTYAADDFYIKWNSVSGATRYRLAVKSLNDGSYAADIWWDDKLTKTKYECDEDDIKPGHRYRIWVAACGSGHDDVLSQYSIEVIAEDECEHDDYENEVDDVEYDQISGDDTYHYATEYYDRVCEDCGETIKKNIEGDTKKEKHSFSGDKCKKCGYTKKTQVKPSISSASVSPANGIVNDTKFNFTVKTNAEATDLLVVAFDGWEITSNYLRDLKSSTSGNTKTWTFWLQMNNINSSYVNIYALNDEGDESSAKKVRFSLSDGVCQHKAYNEYHDDTEYDQISGDDTYHYVTEYYDRVCNDCGETIKKNIEGDTEKEKHNFSGDKCKDCGYTKKAQQTKPQAIKPSISSASVSPTSGIINDTRFYFTVKTNKDTTDLLVVSQDGWNITSNYLNDLRRTTSGDTKTWTFWLQINNVNSSYVNIYALNDEDDKSGAKKVSFSVSEPLQQDEKAPVIGDIVSSAGTTFKEGTSTKITVTVTDENLIEAMLYIDNKQIKNFTSGHITSTLPSLAVGTHNVTVKAKDKEGNETEKSIILTVTESKLNIPTVEVLAATNITATSVTLQGKVTSNSGVRIKKYGFAYEDGTNIRYKWIDGHIDNNKVFTANITGLKPETDYLYQVIAVNENDIEGKSDYVKFITLEGVAEPEKPTAITNNNVLILGVGETKGFLNNKEIVVSQPPYLKNNRTLIPLRLVSEKLGAKVDWEEKENGNKKKIQIITITYNNSVATYHIGDKNFTVKGIYYDEEGNSFYTETEKTFSDDVAPAIKEGTGTSFIPLRMMCEVFFGMSVNYIDNRSSDQEGVIVISPHGYYNKSDASTYTKLISPHVHKWVSNGNGKHSCSMCGKTWDCNGEPCKDCGYSKQVESTNASSYIPKYYEVETLINQKTYPFDDYSEPIEKNIFGRSVTEAAWISFFNMTFEEKINNAIGVFNNKFSEEQWKLILAEVLKQATQHQKNQTVLEKVSSGSSFVSDTLGAGSDVLDFGEKTMKQIDNLSKKIDTSVVYKRNSSLTKKWAGIFNKYGSYLKYGSYATQLFSDVMEDYIENTQYLIAMQEMVDSYIKLYSPEDANAMRNAMDYIVLSYHNKMSSTLTSLGEIGLEIFNEKVSEKADDFFGFIGGQSASKILYTVKAIDIASQIIIDVSGNREKFSAITKSEFMLPLSGHFQLEFYRIGKECQKDGFDSYDNQYLRTIFELCRATQYLNYEYLGKQYTDANNQKWINDAKNSILGRSIVSYYK